MVEKNVLGFEWVFGEEESEKSMLKNIFIIEFTFGIKHDFSRLAQFLSSWDLH